MLGQVFHEKIIFIKNQLAYKQHPVRALIERFKSYFMETSMVLLCTQADEDEMIQQSAE